ncbi:MAG: DUF4417 domain-containing protein [Planctomycetia bacterium]|nr:DUF4417 domain-containing protein [Planctomycetia bacterium]
MRPHETRNLLHLDKVDFNFLESELDIPAMWSEIHVEPNRLIPFNQVKTFRGDRANIGVHFFLDDYQFERVWNRPERYAQMLDGFACVTTPDFSMYSDMPQVMQMWNHYRKQLIGQFWQNRGLTVVPTLNWSSQRSFQFCFDGIPKHSTVAVSSVGCCKNPTVREKWIQGMNMAVQVLQPRNILFYGDTIEFDHRDIPMIFHRPVFPRKPTPQKSPSIGERTRFLMANTGLIFDGAKRLGIPRDEWDDFHQDVILKSMTTKDDFNSELGKISTWAARFIKMVGLTYRTKMQRRLPTIETIEK